MEKTAYKHKLYKSGKFLVTAGLLTVASIGLSVHSVNADEVPSSATKTDVEADTINEQVDTSAGTVQTQTESSASSSIKTADAVETSSESSSEVTQKTDDDSSAAKSTTTEATQAATTTTDASSAVSGTPVKESSSVDENQQENVDESVADVSQTKTDTSASTATTATDKTVSENTTDATDTKKSDDAVAKTTAKDSTDDETKDDDKVTTEATVDTDKSADQKVETVSQINKDAKVVTGSYQSDDEAGTFKYVDADGNAAKGLVQIDGNLQYFDENGNQVKGQFVTVGDYTYYLNAATGNAETKVVTVNGKTVGFDEQGQQVLSGFATDSKGVTYYFNDKGEFQTGLQTIDGKTYYFDEDGHQKKGFSGVFKNQVLYFDPTTGESVSTTTSQIKDGLTVQNTDATPHNAAYDTSLKSFTTVDGYLTAESWYRPKDIQVSDTEWRASTDQDFRPIMMTWWGTKEIQVNYLNFMANQGLIDTTTSFTTQDTQAFLNQAAQSVQLQIEKRIAVQQSTSWLQDAMKAFIVTQDEYNKNSESPGTDHLQGGALTYINSPLTPDSNSNFRLMNRTPTQQDGNQNYTTDNSQGGFELLLANDVDNSNPTVQAEQLNWIYYLTHFGEITGAGSDANFDSIRIDAVDNVDADLLNIAADYFKAAYGVDQNDATSNQHLSILEDWSHNDPQYVTNNGSNQLTMDDYLHTQLIWSLTKNTDIRGTMARFKDYYLVDRSNDSTENTSTPNYSFVRAHDSEVQTVIAEIINKLYPDSGSGLIPTQEQMDAAFKIYNADMNSADKQYTQYNMPSAYAMLLTNKDTIPRVYYGDLYTDDGQYMATKSPYYDAINDLLQARIKYVAGGQSLDVDQHDVLTSVRYGKGAMTATDKGTADTRTEGIGVIVSNDEQLDLGSDQVVLHMGAAHANQDYRALLVTTENGLEKFDTDTDAPVKHTDANGDLIFDADEIKGFKNVEVSGFLSVWVPVGASETQDARTTSSDTDTTDGKTLHSNAALDSNVIYEGFSNFQATPTTHEEFTNVKIAENVDLFKSWGVTSFQLAPQYRSSTDSTFLDSIIQNGYAFTDRYDLGFGTPTKYGTVDDLTTAIKALHANGMQAMADFVPDQIYNLPGQEVTTVNRTNAFGDADADSDMQNVLYVTNSKGGGEYQAKYGGEFLAQLQADYPELFEKKQVSTGETIDASTKIKEWSAKYFNGSDIQGKGAEYVLRDDGTKEYFKITSNSSDSSFLPKQLENQESVTGFTTDENGTTYYSTSGYQAKNSFIKDDNGNYYYFDKDGYMVTGLQNINQSTYYFLPNGVELRDSFVQNHSGNTQYFSKAGKLVTSKYVSDQNGNTYYFDENGNMVTDQIKIIDGHAQYFAKGGTQAKDTFVKGADGNTRYFEAGNGNMAINRFAEDTDGNWYYVNDKGFVVTGWQTINKSTYYFDETGKQLKNAFIPRVDGTVYVNGTTGALVTDDLIYSKGAWYYADGNGVLASGLNTVHDKTYYFDAETHQMLKNITKTINNKTYHFDNNGEEIVNDWVENSDESWSYFQDDGAQVKDQWQVINGQKLYFDAQGNQVKGDSAFVDGHYYYFDKDSGIVVTNQLATDKDGVTRYYGQDGQAITDVEKTIDGVQYYFTDDGTLVTNDYYNVDGHWHYADTDGKMVTGLVTIDHMTQYFDENGNQVKNGFVKDNASGKAYFFNGTEGLLVENDYFSIDKVNWYYADATGSFVTGFHIINGQLQYFNDDGVQVKGAVVENPNNGKSYYFDADLGNGTQI